MPAPFRKACANCVRSKRRCDLVLPQCYRCRVRSLDCSYHHAPSFILARQQQTSPVADTIGKPDQSPISNNESASANILVDEMIHSSAPSIDFNQMELSLPPFPDYDLDWPDIMGNIENYWVCDQIKPADSPSRSVLAGEIYQERIIHTVRRIKAYPSLLVSEGSTPFIHTKLYSGYMPPVMQDVLGVCALYGQKTERNEALVFQAVSHKAAQLTAEYTVYGLSAIQQLAYLQALILYQIIRLFDGDIRQRADAERADKILNEWTQQIKPRMERINSATENDQVLPALSTTADSWRNWIYAESLRRTVLVSFSVQGLYCFLKNGWDDSHHEIQRLSFYAQRALWDAPSEHYWQSAVKEVAALPVRFSSWDSDMMDAKPSDMDDLGMTMMVLMKGVDECCQWIGNQNLERFGLALHGKN